MTPEKRVQNKIIEYLKSLKELGEPIYYERRQAIGIGYKKGLPDIFFVYNGQHVEVEVKKPGGVQSVMQIKYEEYFKSIGVIYILASSREDVMNVVVNLKK